MCALLVTWPELLGNGVLTSMGNLVKNPWTHLMFRHHQPTEHRPSAEAVGHHATGVQLHPLPQHFPRTDAPAEWGTDDVRAKGGAYFGAAGTPSPWASENADRNRAFP